jgi:hypothetical protein
MYKILFYLSCFKNKSYGMVRFVIAFQGIYYFITGLWSLLDMRSFEMVTGPKTEWWLVRMVGALTVAISLVYLLAAKRNKVVLETVVLILGSSLSYMLIDVIYVLNGTIWPIYLADAVLQVLFIAFWITMIIQKKVPQ